MADPVTIGALTASALAMAGEAALKGAVGEAAKDAYKALKSRVAKWAGSDVEALEKTPASPARRAVLAEVIDSQSGEEQAALHVLAHELVAALKRSGAIGLDVGRLEAMEVQLGDITVREGTGARIDEVRVHGTFSTGNITVGGPAKKA
jgi:hypothetical protein